MANEMRLVDAYALWHKTFTCEDAADVRKEIENAPTVDARPVVHGRWKTTDTLLGRCCVCSVCGSCPTMEYRYCPYCGADMRDCDGNG